ncbi:SH3 domain-containing protein [Nitratireductor sp. XY-223]|uniref:SH3 domain-containing protein n=1 Tax=Nitratireductor sp. XY-223 TaxID=2561926 RepID=UPI0010A9A949|nr:SH3 domain-containing protein [Nitratireductor sp. XY-223]
MGRQARTTQRRPRAAAQPVRPRSPSRLIAIALVAAFGGAAGAVLGAALYNTTQNAQQQPVEPATAVETAAADKTPIVELRGQQVATAATAGPEVSADKALPAAKKNNALNAETVTPQLAASGFTDGTQVASTRAFLPPAPKAQDDLPSIASARFDSSFASLEEEKAERPKKKKMTLPSLMEESVVRVDQAETGSIVPPDVAVEVAETEAEIAEMEQKMAALDAENFNVTRQPALLEEAAPATGSGMVKSKARKWVNLRAEPNNTAAVVDIVPAKATILADQNCTRWCGVVYKGQKGYIYRTFIIRPERSSQATQLASADSDFKPERAAEKDELSETAKSVSAYPVTEAEKLGYKKSSATKWVNMRARRSSKSKVLAIVPQNAKFMAETNCKWCRVVYGDKKGYIYKTFIKYTES